MWFPALAHHPFPERETSPALSNMHIYIHVRTYIYVCVSVCPCVPATGRAYASARLQPATEQIRAEMGKPLLIWL